MKCVVLLGVILPSNFFSSMFTNNIEDCNIKLEGCWPFSSQSILSLPTNLTIWILEFIPNMEMKWDWLLFFLMIATKRSTFSRVQNTLMITIMASKGQICPTFMYQLMLWLGCSLFWGKHVIFFLIGFYGRNKWVYWILAIQTDTYNSG